MAIGKCDAKSARSNRRSPLSGLRQNPKRVRRTARTTAGIPRACVGKREGSPGQLRRSRNFRHAVTRRNCRDSRSPSPGSQHVRDMACDEDRRRNHVDGSARALTRNATGCADGHLPQARRRRNPRRAVLPANAFRRPTGSFASPLPPPAVSRAALGNDRLPHRSVLGFAMGVLRSTCIGYILDGKVHARWTATKAEK